MLTLYGYFRSSAAYRVRIALGLKGLAYKHMGINLMPGISEQKSEKYRALNPQGRVPYLIDGDTALSQSPAILEYLEEAYPEIALLPQDMHERAHVRQLASLIGCDIHPLNNLSVLGYLKTKFEAHEADVTAWYSHWILEGFTAFEAILASRKAMSKFCHGDSPGMADIYLVPQVWNARRFGVPLSAFPQITAIDAACNSLDAFIAAAPENQPDAPKSK